MGPLDLVKLTRLMESTGGRAEIKVALIDGPVAMEHPDLAAENIREVPGKLAGACSRASSVACMHGTFVAGMLCAKRGSDAPAICPGCTLLVRPIFTETASQKGDTPSAVPEELASAIIESVNAGARLINLSVALAQPATKGERELEEALNHTAKHDVIIVVAAGNQGAIGSSAITRHAWVIPVTACDDQGRLTAESNLGKSIGRHGLRAPGENIRSLGPKGKPETFGGTSAAAPFVTGTIALLWSEFPAASASAIKLAVTGVGRHPRKTVVPPLLDAWAAYQVMASAHNSEKAS
jgi:subtilisin family serine protease